MSEAMWVALIMAAIPGVWSLISQWRKSRADVADTYQGIAQKAAKDVEEACDEIRRQQEEIKGLSARVSLLEKEKQELVDERTELIERVVALEKENKELREKIEQLQKVQGITPEEGD